MLRQNPYVDTLLDAGNPIQYAAAARLLPFIHHQKPQQFPLQVESFTQQYIHMLFITKKRHALMDMIVIVICATVSGAEGWEAIEEFAHNKQDWLRPFIDLENGVPSHDCIIAYVMLRLSVKGFRECFMAWSQATVAQCGGEIISVDGNNTSDSF